MPRGQRKRGAWDCQIWFEDGSRIRFTSKPNRVFTNAEIAESVRRDLVPIVEAAARPASTHAVDPSAADSGTPTTRESL